MSTATCDSARGWHSGIRSWVRLAAMMPATRATPSTSPLLALPLRTVSRVSAAMTTRPSAIASRSVTALAPTSTMRASPLVPRCVRRATILPGGNAFGGQQRAGRGRYVALPHQALAHQEGGDAAIGEPLEVARRDDTALADDDAVGRNARR